MNMANEMQWLRGALDTRTLIRMRFLTEIIWNFVALCYFR